jgi:homoprotocatechuate degradation regulator HpaR
MTSKRDRGEASHQAVAAAANGPSPSPRVGGQLRPFSRSLPMALLRARETVMQHFRPSLHAAGLTEQQWRVLRALASHGEIDVTGLANATFLLAPSLTRILRELERRKIVRRRADPSDLRAALISLTARGRSIVDTVGVHSERVYRALETRLGATRMEALMTMLAQAERELRAPLAVDDHAATAPDAKPRQPHGRAPASAPSPAISARAHRTPRGDRAGHRRAVPD